MKTEIVINTDSGSYIGVVEDIVSELETGPQNRVVQSKEITVDCHGPLLDVDTGEEL